MEDWLVRSAENKITGPYSKNDLVTRIQAGELKPQDEVCKANDYWFALYEADEVQRQLGIIVPYDDFHEEKTETQTTQADQLDNLLPDAGDGAMDQESTTMMRARSYRQLPNTPGGEQAQKHTIFSPITIGNRRLERPQIWKFITALLIVLFIFTAITILRRIPM